MSVRAMGTMRHACTACGGSCLGVVVRVSPEEASRIGGYGAEMGIADPLDGDALRRGDNGGCVFQQADGLCGIHARYGMEAKPALCSQYPVVALVTEDGMRVGLDPGCYTHASTWKTAPEVTGGSLQASRIEFDGPSAGEEAAILSLLNAEGATVASVLRRLMSLPAGDSLPDGFAGRWVAHLRTVPWAETLEDPTLGAAWKSSLMPIAKAVPTWDPASPPAWPSVSAEGDAFAVDAAMRLIFLRLSRRLGSSAGVALMMLSGAIAVGWSTQDPGEYGRGIAGWSRMMRSPKFLAAVMPDRAGLQRLVTG